MADITTRGVKFEELNPTFDGGGYWNYGGSARLSITGDVNVLGSTDLTIPQGRKLSLDGGGHTYITEESDSNLKFYVGGTERLNISSPDAHFTGDVVTPEVRTAKVTTSGNTSLYLQTGGTGHVYIGDSSNGMNFYHYSSADDGVYSSFDWNGNYYRIATTATSGVWVNDPLKVSGIMETEHIKADNVGSGTTIVRPGTDAQWGASGTSTGRVEITLPGTTASSNHGMVYLQIDVYEYGNTNGPTTYWVGGHNWGSGGNWHSVNAYKIGPGSKKLYLGVRNSRYVVLIGDANSSWNYGSVHVSYANNASFYSNNMDMVDGVTSYGSGQWSATLVTHADSAYTNLKSDLATVVEFKDSHIHAERFVDEDATSFYLKPGGTSVLNAATFGGTITVAGATTLNGGLKVNGPASHNTIKSANDYTLGFNDYNDVNQWWIKAYTNGSFALHENGVADKFTIAAGGNATFAGTVSLPDGSATTPSINNTGDTNTGMYFPGDNQVGFAVDGSRKFYMSTTKAYFQNLSSGVDINAGGLSMSQSSTTDYVLRLTDTGVASYDFTFPDTGTIQLDTDTTSTKTFKITNVGSGEFGLYVGGDSTFTGDVTIQGDLGVTGITTTTNVVNLDLADNIIGLNRGSTSNANDSGIIIERGSTGDNAAFLWDESEDRFMFGTTTSTPAATGNIGVTNVGIEASTARFTAAANAITISNHGDGNNFLNINHSGNESWYFKAASASGTTDYIGIGANGGGEFKIYEDGSIDAAGKITSPQRKYCSASISNSYVKIYRAEGASSQLATAVRITGTSHGTSHVGNFTALVMVNHYEDVYIRSDSGAYTQLTLKVESDNNEDYHLSVKSSSANAATYYFTIEALSSEITITTLPTTTPATDTVHEHTTVFGSRETGEGATLYHKVSGEASFDTSITTPKIMGNPYTYIMGNSGTYDGRLKFKPYSGGREWSFGNESSNFRLQDDSAGVTRMWWDYDGKLAINSTNVNYEAPAATVDIHAGSGAEMLMLRNSTGLGHYFEAGGSGSARHYLYAMGGGAKIRLDSVGPHSYAAIAIGQTNLDFHVNASNLIVGSGSGNQGITIYTGQNQGDYGSIYFADGRADGLEEYRGMITYEQNNEIMRFHTAGHATPALKLDVNRNATFAGNIYLPQYMIHDGDGDTYLEFAGADRIRLVAGAVEFIDACETTQDYITVGTSSDVDTKLIGGSGYIFIQGSDGYIGVNDITPTSPLDINANTAITGTLDVSSTATFASQVKSLTGWFTDNVYMSGGQLYIGASGANSTTNDSHRLVSGSGDFSIQSRESGTWTNHLYINSAGNTTFASEITAGDDINTPTKLVVGESATAEVRIKKTNAGYGKLSWYNNDGSSSTQTAYISHDSAENLYYYLPSGKSHIFYGSGSERFKIGGDVEVVGSTDLVIAGASRSISFKSGSGTVKTTTGNSLILQTNSSDGIVIDGSTQNVGVGGAPTNKFSIKDGSNANFEAGCNSDSIFIQSYNRTTSAWADIVFNTNGESLRIDSSKNATFAGNVSLADTKYLNWGQNDDFKIHHNGSASYLQNYTGALVIQNNQNDGNIVFQSDDGNGGLFDYFSLDGGSTTYAHSATTAAYTKWQDNSRIALGSGKDLQLYHDGSDSFIKNSTGSLVIEQAAGAIALRPVTGENGILIVENAAVSLYYDNSKKLETTNTGATITGALSITGDGSNAATLTESSAGILTIATADDFKVDAEGDIAFDANGGDIRFKDGGTQWGSLYTGGGATHMYIASYLQDKDIIFRGNDGGSTITALTLDMSIGGKAVFNSGFIDLWGSTGSGVFVIGDPASANTHGMAMFCPENGGTSGFLFQQQHAGSKAYMQTDLWTVQGHNGGGTMIVGTEGASVDLYHNNSKKLATVAGGIDVTGYYGFSNTGNDYGFYYGVEPGSTQGIAIKASDTGGAYFDGLGYFWNNNTGNGAGMFQMQNDGATYCRYINFYRGSNSNIIGYIGYNATNTAVTYSTSSSDERLKKNIVAWNEAVLPKFLSLQPKKFNFKAEVGDPGPEKIKGYIAQNEVANFPEVYQLNGEGDDARYGFHPMEMVPYLMKAVKELVEKNQDLEARIVELEK